MSDLVDRNLILYWIDTYASDVYENLRPFYTMMLLKHNHVLATFRVNGDWPKWWSSIVIKEGDW